jgi:hypothetical protein
MRLSPSWIVVVLPASAPCPQTLNRTGRTLIMLLGAVLSAQWRRCQHHLNRRIHDRDLEILDLVSLGRRLIVTSAYGGATAIALNVLCFLVLYRQSLTAQTPPKITSDWCVGFSRLGTAAGSLIEVNDKEYCLRSDLLVWRGYGICRTGSYCWGWWRLWNT